MKGETPLTVLELQHLLLLFNELAAAITPDNAAAAFDTMLKVRLFDCIFEAMLLGSIYCSHAQILILLSKNSGKDVTVIVAGTSDPQDLNSLEGIHSDESMAAIIEKIPSVSQVCSLKTFLGFEKLTLQTLLRVFVSDSGSIGCGMYQNMWAAVTCGLSDAFSGPFFD